MKKCIVCGEELTNEPLITFENMPSSAQNIPTIDEIENDKGITLNLHHCIKCGLIQFDCEPVDYFRDVIRSGGYSTTMTELRRKQYSYLIDKYHLEGKKFLEVGCGQGEFLSVLTEFPVEVYGIENKSDLVELAQEKKLNVKKDFMENENSKIEGAPFDVFLSFNFLEHQPKPNDMLNGIYNNLSENGMGLITVPSFEYILENDGYYELIRDHIAYYTFDTLRFLLEKNGFLVLEEEIINRDTLSIIVKKRPQINIKNIINSYSKITSQVNDYINQKNQEGKHVAIWGASHQGFTIASTASLKDKVDFIIDSAPFKQGKYSPSSHIPIISPEEAMKEDMDSIIIIAPGYVDEIANIIKNEFDSKIEIMTLMTNELQKYEE